MRIIAVCLLLLLSFVPVLPAEAATSATCAEPAGKNISVMSFNVLNNNNKDSNGNFIYDTPAKREDAIAAMIKAYKPDIIGIQEAGTGGDSGTLDWCSALNADLKSIYAYRSLKDDTGLSLTVTRGLIIFYNKSRFTLVSSGGQAYSDPASSKRAFHWVKLKDKNTNTEFFVFNTHWQYDGNQTLAQNQASRAIQQAELAKKVNSLAKNHHFFITGDFNSSYILASSTTKCDEVNFEKLLQNAGYRDGLVDATERYSVNANGTRTALQANDSSLQKCLDHVVYHSSFYTPVKMEKILTRTYSPKLSDHDAILVQFAYKMPSLTVSASEGELAAYYDNNTYYVDNYAKRITDLPITVKLSMGAVYTDSACTQSAGTALTMKSGDVKTFRPENTLYIKFGGAVQTLCLRSCNANTMSKAVFVDKSIAALPSGAKALYCDKWYGRLVTVGVNGFSTIQAAVNAAGDGDQVLVAPGTYTEEVSYTGKSLKFYGQNRTNIKALVVKSGKLEVNTAGRTYETYLSGSITYDIGSQKAGSIMVNGFHFTNRTPTGQIRITGGTAEQTVDLRISNNLFNCYTDGATNNGSALHAMTPVQKTGSIEDNYFHLTKIPTYTDSNGSTVNYTNRGITLRNLKDITIHANYFDGYTGSKLRPFWLSSEVASGSTTPGYGNVAITGNRFENSYPGSLNINNIRGGTNANILIAGNSYGGEKLNVSFAETANQTSQNLPTDKSKITFNVQTNDYASLSITPTGHGVSVKKFTYYVTFRNEDGDYIYAHSVVSGTTAAYKGPTPTKSATSANHYSFKGWVDANGNALNLSSISANTEAYASFTATAHSIASRNWSEPTCTENGYSGDSYCTVCGHQTATGTAIPATGHTSIIDAAVAPTCTDSGLTEGSHCGVCNVVIAAQETVAPLGHGYSYTEVDYDSHLVYCARCEDSFTETHEFTDGVCVCSAEEIVGPIVDDSIHVYHTLDLASDISVTFAVLRSAMADYDNYYLECVLPEYDEDGLPTTSTVRIEPVVNGNYYYFTLTGITAVRMGDIVDATVHMTKDGREFVSKTDSYSVATYAYAMLKQSTDGKMLTLCADLLRYGAEAQRFKGYRTDALVDAAMTAEHRSYLSDTENLSFTATDSFLGDLASPTITWVGKTLDLGSKVGMKFVFNAKNYSGEISDLSMKVSYMGGNGEVKTVTLTGAEAYGTNGYYYSFTFYGLLASELRTIVDVAVYEGSTQLSETLRYSAESYASKNTTGTLADLSKALFAYSDSAKAFFAK